MCILDYQRDPLGCLWHSTWQPLSDDLIQSAKACHTPRAQAPPPVEEDTAFKQPCFAKHCSLAEREPVPCPKLGVRVPVP